PLGPDAAEGRGLALRIRRARGHTLARAERIHRTRQRRVPDLGGVGAPQFVRHASPRIGVRMVTRASLFALIVAVAALAHAQPRPSFTVQPGGVVAATLPASVLQDPGVRRQLGSGLTTTFLVVARLRETDSLSGARVEIRYDLWDEVWLVRRIEFDRREDRQRIASRDAL